MKRLAVSLIIVLSTFALSIPAHSTEDPANFKLIAHVKSMGRTHSHGTVSTYHPGANGGVGTWSHGIAGSSTRMTEIQIGNLIYSAEKECNHVSVGQDYPARIDGKKLFLLAGDKVCKFRISGTREPQ